MSRTNINFHLFIPTVFLPNNESILYDGNTEAEFN